MSCLFVYLFVCLQLTIFSSILNLLTSRKMQNQRWVCQCGCVSVGLSVWVCQCGVSVWIYQCGCVNVGGCHFSSAIMDVSGGKP